MAMLCKMATALPVLIICNTVVKRAGPRMMMKRDGMTAENRSASVRTACCIRL